MLAPIGHQQQFHPEAEAATALAAEVLGSNMILSTFTNTDMRTLKPENPFIKGSNCIGKVTAIKSLALLKLAEAQNFTAIVITVDSPHTGIRDRERRAFFHLPENMQHPHTPAHIPLPELQEGDHPVFNGLMKIAPTWDDIAWMVQQTDLPILLKGIVSPTRWPNWPFNRACKGLIVSNHGGRVLDTCIPPLKALQLIKKAVANMTSHFYMMGVWRRGSECI